VNAQALEPEAGFAKAQAQLLGTPPYASIDTQSFDSVSPRLSEPSNSGRGAIASLLSMWH